MPNDAAGSPRWLEVAPERLVTWIDDFGRRHGPVTVRTSAAEITFRAADGAAAQCHPPFPPLPATADPPAPARPPGGAGSGPGAGDSGAGPGSAAQWAQQISEHAQQPRTVAVLLVRLGGYAAGVFTGPGARLEASKVGSRLVHGRSAAGGQSQQRFARRRQKQAAEALGAAASTAAAVFAPFADTLQAVVLGGDRQAIATVCGDPRLQRYARLAVDRFLTVPDPKLTVLRATPRQFRAVRIRLTEPSG